MQGLSLEPNADTYERLAAAYAEPHRHYHTAAHIGACLAELEAARGLARFAFEVEAALWFHDAIYDPKAPDNERRSAEWARAFLSAAGAREILQSFLDRSHVYALPLFRERYEAQARANLERAIARHSREVSGRSADSD